MQKITLKIDGMMCGMCESHINDTVRQHFAVQKVTSSHTKGETVILAERAPDEAELRKVIAATGYELKSITVEPYEKKSGCLAESDVSRPRCSDLRGGASYE